MKLSRSYGILFHPTSLPGPWGIGVLGEPAHNFIKWLHQAGASWWQMLPLGVTGYGDSPYQSFSAFAGNPYLIDPEQIFHNRWMDREDPPPTFATAHTKVNYGEIYTWKWAFLQRAHAGFTTRAAQADRDAFNRWCEGEKAWLDDYALFMTLKNHFDGAPWTRWPKELRERDEKSLARARREHGDHINFHSWTQWLFHHQWSLLQAEARRHGISLIGDMPIFVSHDSADVWAHPEYFLLNKDGSPEWVAGVPPDYFSKNGQRWGNPLYNWEFLKKEGFSWWVERVRHSLKLTDWVRIDHFRGFEAYWEIPAAEATAINGSWVKAPGEELFQALQDQLGTTPIIAEDLGLITEEVEELRDRFQFPGMKVLQFAFEGDEKNPFLPHNYPADGNCLVYTGTHDNDTTLGWYKQTTNEQRQFISEYLSQWDLESGPVEGAGSKGQTTGTRSCPGSDATPGAAELETLWSIMALGFMSSAKLAIIPLQDALSLDERARMNEPSKVGDSNWTWRVLPDQLDAPTASRLRKLAERTARIPRVFPIIKDNRFTKSI